MLLENLIKNQDWIREYSLVFKPLSKKILFEDLSNINISVDVQNDEYVFVL